METACLRQKLERNQWLCLYNYCCFIGSKQTCRDFGNSNLIINTCETIMKTNTLTERFSTRDVDHLCDSPQIDFRQTVFGHCKTCFIL